MLNKVYAFNKVYALNKQVSKYVVMQFSNNTSIVSFVFTGYEFVTMHVLRAFSIYTGPLNSRLRKAWPDSELHGIEEPRTM